MENKRMIVGDLPITLKDACIERGHSISEEIDLREAVAEWTAWEIGDRHWGAMAFDLIKLAHTKAK